ncbi:hypothetical protein TWF281_006890 [Arthrobotrys megalospora]
MLSGVSSLFTLVLATLPAIRVAAQAPPDGETITFNSISNFAAVRNCATCCFGAYVGCYFNLEITKVVGCSLNSCICSRTDIRSIITTHLQSCVSKGCSAVSGDVSIALSVFNAYCEDYFGANNAGATPTDGDGSISGVSPVTVTETQMIPLSTLTTTLEIATVQVAATTITVFPDQNSPNNKDSASTVTVIVASSGLSDDKKIGLGVGLGIGIPLVAALLFVAYRFSKALTAPPEMPQPIQGSYVG